MQIIAAFAVMVFLLGMFFGLPYQQAYRRRLTLLEDDKNEPSQDKSDSTSLDKPLSRG